MVGEEICGAVVSIRFQVRTRTQAAQACLSLFTAAETHQGSNAVKIYFFVLERHEMMSLNSPDLVLNLKPTDVTGSAVTNMVHHWVS